MKKLARALAGAFDLRDLHCYGGALLAAGGLWMIGPPYALVALGIFFAWLGLRRVG